MNNLRQLIYMVPNDTTVVMKDLATYCGLNIQTIRNHMQNARKTMSAEDALRMRNFFRRFFPCEIEDLIKLDDDPITKRLKLVRAQPGQLSGPPERARKSRKSA